MKIPQTFIPEKDLENKILNLTKGPKIFRNEEVYDVISQEEAEPYYILCMAEEVVKKLGNYYGMGFYQFKDKENKFIIKRQFYPYVGLTLYLKKGLFKKKVLKTKDDRTILIYNRGEWKKDLEKLYEIAAQK